VDRDVDAGVPVMRIPRALDQTHDGVVNFNGDA
jgi:hypothetical protein